ncbi:MAG TPA: hypothetical protein VIY69_02910 [Candidatus Acidoferrales bacterium]
MRSHFHFAPGGFFQRTLGRSLCTAVLLTVASVCLSIRAAQNSPGQADIVAHIEGNDLSINDQMLTRASTLVSVANGNVVTVHSGEASMQLTDGGEVSVCGPAKFTVLANSDGAITLALDFGRMHVDLPASVNLRVLTPMIVATPIDIEGGKRDIIVGLDQNDSLCVLATLGAVQLEQQFSGQRLIIPEAGDFSLQSGQLVPVADAGASCQCAAVPQVTPAEPPVAPETAVEIPPQSAGRPVAPETQQQVAQAPPVNAPVYKIDLPPLVYSSAPPSPPNVPTQETAALIREVHDDPDWDFTGQVLTPAFAREMSRDLGVSGAPTDSSATPNSASTPKKSGGFWASLKHLFIG